MGYQELRKLFTATIAAGASLSDAVDLTGYTLVGIQIPAAWTVTATTVTLYGSVDGSTYGPLHTIGIYQQYPDPEDLSGFLFASPLYHFAGVRYVKLLSGTTATPVAQVAKREIKVVGWPTR